MAHAKHDNLWAVTTGQRVRYSGAIVAMAVANICMFGAPLIAKYAIDVVVAKDVTLGTPMLVTPSEWLEQAFGVAERVRLVSAAVGRARGCGDRRRRCFPVRARPLVCDRVRSDRAPLARDVVSPSARSARGLLRRRRYRRPGATLQFRRRDVARVPVERRRRDRPLDPADSDGHADPVLARHAARVGVAVPDPVHRTVRVHLLPQGAAGVPGHRRSGSGDDRRAAGKPDRHPGRARVRPAGVRDREVRREEPDPPRPEQPADHVDGPLLGHGGLLLADADRPGVAGRRVRDHRRPHFGRHAVRVPDVRRHGDLAGAAARPRADRLRQGGRVARPHQRNSESGRRDAGADAEPRPRRRRHPHRAPDVRLRRRAPGDQGFLAARAPRRDGRFRRRAGLRQVDADPAAVAAVSVPAKARSSWTVRKSARSTGTGCATRSAWCCRIRSSIRAASRQT